MKNITIIFIIALAILFVSCDNIPKAPGYVHIELNDLDQLTNYTVGTSRHQSAAYPEGSGSYIVSSMVSTNSSDSFTFTLGNPDHEFPGGERIYIITWIDIDGDGNWNGSGDYYQVGSVFTIDGDYTYSISAMHFTIQ